VAETLITYGMVRIDLANHCVWKGEKELRLTPKAVAVLALLLARPGHVVTKEEFLRTTWAGTVVSEAALTVCIRELRQALEDNARKPQYIETVHRRGFRWIALLTIPPVPSSTFQVPRSSPIPNSQPPTPSIVGRDAELTQLHHLLEKALTGERQLVFVTGEPGIGKTTLLEVFLRSLGSSVQSPAESQNAKVNPSTSDARRGTPDIFVAWGQCIEQYGSGEAYLPILSALSQLGRETNGQQLIAVLTQHAPTWLVQLPALLSASDFDALQRKVQGATRGRMLRELAEALEALTAETSLVLVLEDLHWSDPSTVEVLAFLARRRQPARLLVIGTYRPMEMLSNGHPLRNVVQELQSHRLCEEVSLPLLNEAEVAEYLAVRMAFPSPSQGEGQGEGRKVVPHHTLAHQIHQRTEGNPLFMVNVTDALLTQDAALTAATNNLQIPLTIQQMIAQQFEHLPREEQQLLEIASAAGMEFAAATLTPSLTTSIATVEAHCASLARREQFLRTTGTSEWPDGTISARYSFRHALYQEVIYERVTPSRRMQVHQQIGERLEQSYGPQTGTIATELALHFERAHEYQRAVHYLQNAGQSALQRAAHQEASVLITHGLELLQTLPDTTERTEQEIRLQLTLGHSAMTAKGYTAPEAGQAYTRAYELCQQAGETPHLFPTLFGLFNFYLTRAEHHTAREFAEQMLRIARHTQDSALLMSAHLALGQVLRWLGEPTSARDHFEAAIPLYDEQQQHISVTFYTTADPGVSALNQTALTLWPLGYPDTALRRSNEALTLARRLGHPFSLAFALDFAAELHGFCGYAQQSHELNEASLEVASKHDFLLWLTIGSSRKGFELVVGGQKEEGLTLMHGSHAAWQAAGVKIGVPGFLAGLALAHWLIGQSEGGLAAVDEGLTTVEETGARYSEAPLYILKGWLTLQHKSGVRSPQSHFTPPLAPEEAEGYFHRARAIARQQQARMYELLATTGLAWLALWRSPDEKKAAHQMLSELYNWFTEGFDTEPLKNAKAVLEALGH